MTMIGKAAKRLLRSTALVSCSLGALLAAPAVSQASGTITPYYGALHPFYGALHPFYGALHPFTAATDTASVAFYGTTSSNAYWGQGAFNPFTWVPNGGSSKQVGPLNYVQYSQIGGFWTNETNAWLPLWQTWQTAQDNSAAAATATANAAALRASAAAATAAAKTQADKNNALAFTTAANGATTAATTQTANAAAALQTVSSSLQSFFFGSVGTANATNASLATFWTAEIASRPKGFYGSNNGINQIYQRVVANEIYKILKPYGAVAQLTQTGNAMSIDLTSTANINALAQSTASDQAQLYSNIYDRMMDYSGTNHVDWWMGAANWTPSLARIQTGGTAATTNYSTLVGMIDYTVNAAGKHQGGDQGEQDPNNGDGTGGVTNGHGAAVYSLIKGAPVAA